MTQTEDMIDSKKDLSDKKSMKTILAQLLSSTHGITPIHVRISFNLLKLLF